MYTKHLPLQDPPKFSHNGIFGLKIYVSSGNPLLLSRSHFFRKTIFNNGVDACSCALRLGGKKTRMEQSANILATV
jgi:hypothetical protein